MYTKTVRLVVGFSFLAGIALVVARFGLYTEKALPGTGEEEVTLFI